MAGIGVKLTKIYEKNTIATDLYGFFYSSLMTVAPMFLVIGVIILIQWVMGFSDSLYSSRELFASTVLYIFIFSLLSASPFNAVLSRYLSDIIFDEHYEDIMPCFYVGLLMNVVMGLCLAVPFCIHEYLTGLVPLYYVFTGFCGFLTLLMVFYSMLYLNITKDYSKISLFFLIGMTVSFILAWILHRIFGWEITYTILFSLVVGFSIIGSLEFALLRSYFRQNSRRYKPVLRYFKKYWQLVAANFLYTLGLYIHNFVFWTTPEHLIVVRSFVSHQSYDMATCLAMFTNISATIIFISRIEMNFHDRYKAYSEAVIGGRGMDVENAKSRMFLQLADEILSLSRIQFIITVVVFLFCIVVLPQFGFGGSVMRIYPMLSLGYYILFLMYAEILFLYYFNDLTGAVITTASFALFTCLGAILSTHFTEVWYGTGLVIGAFVGFSAGYARLRWVERNLDAHVFCAGHILKRHEGAMPSNLVYDRDKGIVPEGAKA
ncbi:MAG: exopolysaccharide Pel transporter PelG [Solobacterium sp.]|nr:exopolysaccharide Pel transporter PelG [Solobacterium sp.]